VAIGYGLTGLGGLAGGITKGLGTGLDWAQAQDEAAGQAAMAQIASSLQPLGQWGSQVPGTPHVAPPSFGPGPGAAPPGTPPIPGAGGPMPGFAGTIPGAPGIGGPTQPQQSPDAPQMDIPAMPQQPVRTAMADTGTATDADPDPSASTKTAAAGFEGYDPNAKWDYRQYSVGFGTRGERGQHMSREEASGRLQDDLWKAKKAVLAFAPNTPQGGPLESLTTFTMNLGTGWQHGPLGRAVQAQNWSQAAQMMQDYTHAGGRVIPGLQSRRREEGNMMLTGQWSPQALAAGEAALSGQPERGGPGSMRPPMGMPPGGLDVGQLSRLLDERVPGLSQRAKFFALKSGMGLLNAESKQMMQAMSIEQRQQGLELSRARLGEQEVRDADRRRQQQFGQMTKLAEYGLFGPEVMARVAAGEDARDIIEDEMRKGNTNTNAPTAEATEKPNPKWGGLTQSQVDWGAVDWITNGKLSKDLLAPGGGQKRLQQNAYRDRMEELARMAGLTPQELQGNSAKAMAWRAGLRMLSTRSENINLLSNELEKMLPLMNELAGKLDTTKYPTFNKFIQAYLEGSGDEDVVKYGNAVNSLRYLYARLIQGSGTISVSAVDDADKAMNRYWSKGQVKAMTEMVTNELQRMRAGTEKTMRESKPGLTTVPLPGATPAPAGPTGGSDPLGLFQ